jgi:glycosyltransferase involved in cell wall biosynthesis
VPVQVFPRQRTFPYLPVGLYRALARAGDAFDLVHLHGVASIDPLLVALAVRGIPVVVSPYYHPGASTPWLELCKWPFDRIVVRWLLRRARRVVCVSSAEWSELVRRFGREIGEKTVVIPCGVECAPIRQTLPFDLNGARVVLYAGRLEQYKNVHRIVDAVPHLPEPFALHIIGDGTYRDHLREQVRALGLEDRVHFVGAVGDGDFYRWLRTCAVFVTLSSYESFGISVLEALAAGKPVVVNDRWGLHELAQAFPGMVIPVQAEEVSPQALAGQIVRACSLAGRPNLEPYDWDTIARQVSSLYREVCEEGAAV